MLTVEVINDDGVMQRLTASAPVMIGKDEQCGIRLAHWRIGKRHACVSQLGDFLQIEDLGSLAGTRVNGIRCAQHFPLLARDEVQIGGYRLRFELLRPGKEDPVCANGPLTEPTETFEPQTPVLDPQIRSALHAELIAVLDVRKLDLNHLPATVLRVKAREVLQEMLHEDDHGLSIELQALALESVVSDVAGLGVLQPLIEDPEVSEIMVNRFDQIYVERAGTLMPHSVHFANDHAVRTAIERIVYPLGRRIDDSSPMVDARLPDGSRVNAVIKPIALHGACLTIRKFPTKRLQMQDLIQMGSISEPMGHFLALAVLNRSNILISGGTGSGKTTLLNVLGSQVPRHQRVITIEDAAELQIGHPHVVSLEARPANVEGSGAVSIRDLVRNALRMRPDRIIVGECRGGEAIDMLAAMNTGHDGSLTTLHANSPRDALSRLETMVLMAGKDLPLTAIRDQIARAIGLIVQQTRLADGRRVISAVDEITGMESGQIQLQPLIRYDFMRGTSVAQGLPPVAMRHWRELGPPQLVDAVDRWFAAAGQGI